MTRPRGTCPACGRQISGRMPVKGKLLLRKHKPFMSGTKASGYTRAPDCKGSGKVVDLLSAVDQPAGDEGA